MKIPTIKLYEGSDGHLIPLNPQESKRRPSCVILYIAENTFFLYTNLYYLLKKADGFFLNKEKNAVFLFGLLMWNLVRSQISSFSVDVKTSEKLITTEVENDDHYNQSKWACLYIADELKWCNYNAGRRGFCVHALQEEDLNKVYC